MIHHSPYPFAGKTAENTTETSPSSTQSGDSGGPRGHRGTQGTQDTQGLLRLRGALHGGLGAGRGLEVLGLRDFHGFGLGLAIQSMDDDVPRQFGISFQKGCVYIYIYIYIYVIVRIYIYIYVFLFIYVFIMYLFISFIDRDYVFISHLRSQLLLALQGDTLLAE